MNLLILGGLLLLALIAIVAAVLLVMGERGFETRAGNSVLMNPMAMPAAATGTLTKTGAGTGMPNGRSAATESLSSQRLGSAAGMTSPATSASTSTPTPAPTTRTLPSMSKESIPPTEVEEESGGTGLDGEFHELSAELHALHTRAQEMERRISTLMEIVDRLEHDHGGVVAIDIDADGDDSSISPI
jgi:hypothetical protein